MRLSGSACLMLATLAGPAHGSDLAPVAAGLVGSRAAAIAGAIEPLPPRSDDGSRFDARRVDGSDREHLSIIRVQQRNPDSIIVENSEVSTNQPWIERTYWNCRNPSLANTVTAHAEHGYVRGEVSSRIACGVTDYPVKQFVYTSESGFVGSDIIRYYDSGRLVAIGNLTVRPGNPQWRLNTKIHVNRSARTLALSIRGCEPTRVDLRTDHGLTDVEYRHLNGDQCTGRGLVRTDIFYRAKGDFIGEDRLIVYSSRHSPFQFQVDVSPDGGEPDAREKAERDARLSRERDRQEALERETRLTREKEEAVERERLKTAEAKRQAQEAEARLEQQKLQQEQGASKAEENARELTKLKAQLERARAEAEDAKTAAAKAEADLKRASDDRAEFARIRAAADRDAERIRGEIAERDKIPTPR